LDTDLTNLPSVSIFCTSARDHGPSCVPSCVRCELRGQLRSIAGWATLYELTKGGLNGEEAGRLVEVLRRNVWEAQRVVHSAPVTGFNKAARADFSNGRTGWNYRKRSTATLPVSPSPTAIAARWLVETVNPVVFVGSALKADSKPVLLRQLAGPGKQGDGSTRVHRMHAVD